MSSILQIDFLKVARRKLIVVGDSAILANHEFYARMLGEYETSGAYTSVWEDADL